MQGDFRGIGDFLFKLEMCMGMRFHTNTKMAKLEWGWLLFHVCQNSLRSTRCECDTIKCCNVTSLFTNSVILSDFDIEIVELVHVERGSRPHNHCNYTVCMWHAAIKCSLCDCTVLADASIGGWCWRAVSIFPQIRRFGANKSSHRRYPPGVHVEVLYTNRADLSPTDNSIGAFLSSSVA